MKIFELTQINEVDVAKLNAAIKAEIKKTANKSQPQKNKANNQTTIAQKTPAGPQDKSVAQNKPKTDTNQVGFRNKKGGIKLGF